MTGFLAKHKSVWEILKEAGLCLLIIAVLLTMDRCLENLYFFFLYDTGKRALDVFMALYLHAHRWFTVLIPSGFLVWLWVKRTSLRFGALLPICGAYLLYLLTSLLKSNGEFPARWVNTSLYPIVMLLFVTMMCSTERGIRRFCRVGSDVYILLALLNIAFTVHPQFYHFFTDWEPDFLLSADNLTGFPLLFGAVLVLLDLKFNRNESRCILYFILFFANQILIHCASAMIAGAILGIYLFFPRIRKLMERKSLTLFVLLSVLLCMFLCFCSWFYFHTEFGFRLMDHLLDLLKSLYIRFIIWNGVLALIVKKPILGYGLGEQAEFFQRPNTSLSYNAHNAYLQTLYEGGLVTTCGAVAVLVFLSEILKKCPDRKLAGLFTTVIFAELIMMQSSITSWFTWYPVFLIAQIAAMACTLPSKGDVHENKE